MLGEGDRREAVVEGQMSPAPPPRPSGAVPLPIKDGEEWGGRHHFFSHSGTRSAAMIVSAAMRSATTAKRSPSTMTSGTSGRLL